MNYDVIFHDVVTTIGINPSIKLHQARFIPKGSFGTVNRKNNTTYSDIGALQVFCSLESEPEEGRKLFEPLDTALYVAEEIMTALVATTQEEFYLEKPIKCTYKGKRYVLEGGFWNEVLPNSSVIRGGETFIDNADFIDEPRNFHPMFHLYRVAKDESYTRDYRALNLWRFFEAFYGKKGDKLKKKLTANGLEQDMVDRFYHSFRCAVSHAEALNKDPLTDEVILPRSIETESNGGLLIDLSDMLKFADKIVKDYAPGPTDIVR